jgi:hypothetical protein
VVPRQSLADGLGVHVGVAVHVAAGPGAEVQDGGQAHRAGARAVELLERLGDLLVERRHHAVEDLHQVEEDLLALIRYREPLARQLFGLPRRGELRADAAPDAARLVRREARVEPLEQALRDALLLAQQRAAARLGGMRREHRLDRERADQLEHLLRAEARGFERADGILDAARLRALAVLEEVIAAAADAVYLLGEIHHLEPHRERPQQIARQSRRPVAHAGGELGARLAGSGAAADGGDAVELDQLEQLVAALFAQDLADQRAERVHIVAQRLVLGREVDIAAQQLQSSQVLALAAKSGRCARTTQKRCPEGAAITNQPLTAPMRRAPSFSRRRTSASMSSASMSRCTRLSCCTCWTSRYG